MSIFGERKKAISDLIFDKADSGLLSLEREVLATSALYLNN